ncbi:MAG: energy transducer TonB [Deltaproteobacteria bacterium]|jgi:protein TonB|nr:energy transducer TonB [Deltaproteobacteria bacterium]
MTYQIRGIGISIILHVLLVAAVVSAGSLIKEPCRSRVITFDIARSEIKEVDFSAPPKAPLNKPTKIKRPAPVIQKELSKIVQEKPVMTSPISDVPLPEPAPASRGEQTAAFSRQDARENGTDGGHGVQEGVPGEGEGETAEERYLREHFLYIRDRILARIVYPNLARRMGWHGRVLTSFVIHVDGTVSDVRIVSSSGFKVLDQNAVSTIRDVAPFPKPPIMAKIIIPVTYRLRPG